MQKLSHINLVNPVNLQHSLSHGKVGWWLTLPGLEGGKYYYDLMGLNHGTLTGLSTSTTGWKSTTRSGGYGHIALDGTSSTSVVGTASSIFDLTTNLSFGVWAKFSGSINGGLIEKYQASTIGYRLIVFSGSIFFSLGSGSLTQFSVAGFNDGNWHRIIATYANSNAMTLYVDGVSVGTGTKTGPLTTTSNAVSIGKSDDQGTLVGSIDDACIWSRALSAQEIFADYEESKSGYPTILNRITSRVFLPRLSPLFRRTINNRSGSRSAV